MAERMIKKLTFFVLILFLIGFASASITLSKTNHSILKEYGLHNRISGWINLSLNQEPTNTSLIGKFGTSVGKGISLLDLIKKSSNSNFVYSCDVPDCKANYVIDGELKPLISLLSSAEQSSIIGLNITGENINTISKFTINITTNGTDSSILPLSIDILNDGADEWQAYTSSSTFSPASYGCYDSSATKEEAEIPTEDAYCETISLQKSPSVKIGAVVTGASGIFTMSIDDNNGNSGSCDAEGTGEISCIVEDFKVSTAGDYFVCITAQEGEHNINYNDGNPEPCGFAGSFSGTFDGDYEIFAQTKKYAPVINVFLNTEESESSMGTTDMELKIEEYIESKYANNCSNGCIIPIKITSGINQEVNLSDARLNYKKGGTTISGRMDLANLKETNAKITASMQRVYLDDADFYVPTSYGNYTFYLSIGTKKIFSEKIKVIAGPEIKLLIPSSTAVNYSTQFRVIVDGDYNITKYIWDFGDGKIENTTTKEAVHEYAEVGTYNVKVTAIDSKGRNSFNNFNVVVQPISEIIDEFLNATKENVAGIKADIASQGFSLFEQKGINYSLNLSGIDATLNEISSNVAAAQTEAEFESAFYQLISLAIPQALRKTDSGSDLIFYSERDAIDLDALKNVGGGSYTSAQEEGYKEAVLMWEVENIQANLTFNEISASYEGQFTPFLTTFEIEIENIGTEDSYLLIRKMENLMFEGNYSMQSSGDYYYLVLGDAKKDIKFSTTEEGVTFANLPLFISPKITALTPIEVETLTPYEEGKVVLTNPGLFFTIVVIVLVVALIIWVALQIWYAKKYEHYLFKNKENLSNLVNYIIAVKKKGIDERELIERLKKVGWTSEQVKYVLKKYARKINTQ